MDRMGKAGALAAGLVALASVGCGDEGGEGEFTVTYYVSDLAGKPNVDFVGLFDHWPGMLPPMAAVAPVSVNGVPLTRSPNNDFVLGADLPRLQQGETYACTVDLPWAPNATSTVEMVHPAQLTSPASGAVLSREEDLEVTWSESLPDETDQVYLRVLAPGPTFGMLFTGAVMPPDDAQPTALPGQSQLTIPKALLQEWVATSGIALAANTPWELVLSRSRSAPSSPASAHGRIWLAAEISTVPVSIAP